MQAWMERGHELLTEHLGTGWDERAGELIAGDL
jgi:hypothetical protein